jgi:uncharacterized protein YbbC (DUF1343 family)
MNIMFSFSGKISDLVLVATLLFSSCNTAPSQPAVLAGCERTELYLQKLKGKSVGLVANHTSVAGSEHLADFLIRQGIGLTRIFAPEHGFRGDADAGADIRNDVDATTGVPVVSLYGNKTKPAPSDLLGIDIMIYDIQDVGVRFYTYISTLHYLMEACAENNIPLLILDRPDPLGYYVDGPILENEFRSFVGLHPIPVVYGMTPGELALMINGEGWLKDGEKCNLQVIPCSGYDHDTRYQLPVNPSPNLNCMQSIYLYPSICLFEGTIMSLGRGTSSPFRVIGHPDYPDKDFSFIPRAGKSNQNPLLKDQVCYGIDLQNIPQDSLEQISRINLEWLIDVSHKMNRGRDFFISYIDRLAGTAKFREQILEGDTEQQIRQSWQQGLDNFCKKRAAYLLYPDFTR